MNDTELTDWIERAPLPELAGRAAALRDAAQGRTISYSRKVFIPLTKLCRDVCHYCTFAERPRAGRPAYLSPDQVLAIARAGAAAGCTEALFTLGDKPELRYRAAREALAAAGYATTIEYLHAMCVLVRNEAGLLPHVNPGVMTRDEVAALREVSASQGLMLETISERLCQPGGVHFGSPDKLPARRMETIRLAGELAVPFTTGILIGIGETRRERIDSLFAIRDLHRAHGHIQEVIVQNFRAKPNTKRANAPEPDLDDLLWSIAAARVILPMDVHVQAPPNLSPGVYGRLIEAGIDDWGGVSPVTPDHVNPEAPWPAIGALASRSAAAGKILVARLPVYPDFGFAADRWLAPPIAMAVRRAMDSDGWAREDEWAPGLTEIPAHRAARLGGADAGLVRIVAKATDGARLDNTEIIRLFAARDADYDHVIAAADALRREMSGHIVRYVVNRNINYTNI
ncbi:MAG: 7,8-didemethyl-8-hydroxy-5-deazariboflavin synthase CofG, partial [Acetobacteraceae bacterium]